MRNYLIISLLILSVGFCQRLSEVIETYKNGNIKSITYHKKTRDGIEKVKYEEYHQFGQKITERNYRDGKEDGLYTRWYDSGQKSSETTFKDGIGISEKQWNKDGSVKE